ncbi:MAG: M23 family metallopeptidase [Gemmatimonadetes bacterium]|nr:M23 family metallopeptidase [Gemmatimonadota bacterium]MDA1104768.1 M23 family metallopeptidase [Gemmatimonadota bacterium]
MPKWWLLTAGLVALPLFTGCHLPRWPVDAPIISGFGVRFLGARPDIHRGVDLDVPTGTPVAAMADARVRFAGGMRGFGSVVWLDHGGGVLTIYAHLSVIQVRAGERVDAGQVVGLSGASGSATTPHLHFEVWRWGREVDPVPLLGGPPRRS